MAMKSDIVARSKLDTPDDQKQAIFERLGNLDQYEVLDDEVLTAVYVPSEVAVKGTRADGTTYELITGENHASEFRWQGKIGLVVKIGPQAFKFHMNGQPYEGVVPKVGDWVIYHIHDSHELFLRGAEHNDKGDFCNCRRVRSLGVKMSVKDPRTVR